MTKKDVEKCLKDFCEQKQIEMPANDIKRIVDGLECDWEKKYKPRLITKNLLHDTYEDYLQMKGARMPLRQINSATPMVYDGVEVRSVAKKIDDLLFIQNKHLFELYKDIDTNKDGHVCTSDLSSYLQQRTNLSKPEIDTFIASIGKPNNQLISFQEFHSRIYPGFSQNENYNPGSRFTNVIGITNLDANEQKKDYKNTINFIENARKGFKVSGLNGNCELTSLLLWRQV